ncbi:MAG: threonine synthase [Granulosicoccaceae bacterium]
MNYVSTRGDAPVLDFCQVVTTGLATDGGLYVPETWPKVSTAEMEAWKELTYPQLVVEVMQKFVGESISREELAEMAERAYGSFTHPAIAPLVQLEDKLWVMELFHGPTLAFKDFALQFLGQLFDHILAKSKQRRTIVGATSGDTGSAAIEAVRGSEFIDIFMLHPHGRVSEVQRRQMTTIPDANVRNLAVDGDFDDCQGMVKAMFNDLTFRDEVGLSAVNSINWARVAAQVVYYFRAALALGAPGQAVSFSVPSGNFGNVFAGYVAKQMGLPIQQFVVGSNRNDILTRFFASGAMEAEPVVASLSPSMDIQVSSNFERLLFELADRDGDQVRDWMGSFSQSGRFSVSPEQHRKVSELFAAHSLSDAQTKDEMRRLYESSEYLIDPHSAIGVAAARAARADNAHPMIVLGTAHPAKFPDAVRAATNQDAALPPRVAHIMRAVERVEQVPNDVETIKAVVRDGS